MALMAQDGSPSLSGEGGRTAGKFTQVAYTSLRAAGWGLRPRSEITALIARVVEATLSRAALYEFGGTEKYRWHSRKEICGGASEPTRLASLGTLPCKGGTLMSGRSLLCGPPP